MTFINENLGRLWIILLVVILGSCNITSSDDNIENPEHPNIVFILADDLGVYDLSVTGSEYYETPNIDKIALEGTIFTQGYATSRVCSPSRASIMTGKFTARTGITDWIGAKSGEAWRASGHNYKLFPAAYNHHLAEEDITIAEAMKAEGYTTFFAGKWHLGSKGSWPTDHGFDINIGGWDSGSPRGGYFSPWENPNLPNFQDGENLSMRLAHETSNFIEEHQNKPFLAYLSFYAVHSPIQTSQVKWRKYRDKAESQRIADHGFEMERRLPIRVKQDNPVYAGLVEQMDDAVGLVLQKLKETGLDQNTVVVFTSDNGGVASGDAYSTSNLPLRGGKGYQWEGGIREPYFIYVPWLKDAPKKVETPVTGADFYPTLLDLTNIPLKPSQHMDGVSLLPLLERESINERPLYWHYPHYSNQGGDPSSMIRKGSWKLIHYWEDGSEELYNLDRDPDEQNNVAGHHPEKVSEMGNELKAFLSSVNANNGMVDPDYDKELADKQYQDRKSAMLFRLEKQRVEMLKKDFQPNDTWWDSKIIND